LAKLLDVLLDAAALKRMCYDVAVKPTVYIETSVASYLTARPSRDLLVAAHQQVTHEWWENALPRLEPCISAAVISEASSGDPVAAAKRLEALAGFTVLGDSVNVRELSRAYFSALELPVDATLDAYHLAAAAWHGMDYLVTWNCRHIASGRVRRIVADINESREIRSPVVCTPEELLNV